MSIWTVRFEISGMQVRHGLRVVGVNVEATDANHAMREATKRILLGPSEKIVSVNATPANGKKL